SSCAHRTHPTVIEDMRIVATRSVLNRVALYRALAPHGNPTLHTLDRVLAVFGLRLTVAPIAGAKAIRRSECLGTRPTARRELAPDSDTTKRKSCEPRRGHKPPAE